MKVAIFAMWGGPVENKMAPEGCPVEYVRPENRHELAEWLVMNANNKGPFIIEKWQEGFTTYEYLFQYGKNDFPLEFLARIVVVDVDQSRPWLIHNYDGWEEIWYIDVKANRNQVIPEVFKAKVRDYANREKEERIKMLQSLYIN